MPIIDYAKRRRIMQRSMELGHCICDPRRPCPCDVFKNDGICPCAGERPDPVALDDVKLTEMVHNAGCASKIAPADLDGVLSRLPEVTDAAVLCGLPAGDDAGIYRLPDGTCVVQTVDVMTPCVDDPHTFGRICAANCLSDVYAMGGAPKTALSVLAFPSETHDGQIMYHMMRGAMEVLDEAGCSLIGGHSVKDEEIKLGFAITGTIDADRAARRDALQPGDALVLTKPLGVGVLNFCRQIARDVPAMAAVEASMAALNRPAAEAMVLAGSTACTDVTGFGLFGHLVGMVRSAGMTAQVFADRLPAFDGAVAALADGVVPGAVERNTEYVADDISRSDAVSDALYHLGFDAQTSGGLLIAVAEAKLDSLLEALQSRDCAGWVVGRVTEPSDGRIVVTLADEAADAATLVDKTAELPQHAAATAPGEAASTCCSSESDGRCSDAPAEAEACCSGGTPAQSQGCCSDIFGGESIGRGTSPESRKAFAALMRSTGRGGAIDERSKELINVALVLFGRCRPCFQAHWQKAQTLGLSREQLDEAAWCAAAMGGAVVRMFYQEMLAEVGEDA
ncbi:MAG: selenide, water dikinase SelD [Planctomycetes bacterium]|jgi:selenide,water dikinase|nr:selenide, water dikinase SelD [Planctomycetota bacterium]